jgi:putative ABC transport system substrate-binding protein
MRELGWIEGRTVVFVERYDHGDQSRYPKLAAELVASNVDVLFVVDAAVPAVRQATHRIPIVCADFFDPIAQKITTSLSRPPDDITGLSWQSIESAVKRLQMTKELIPAVRRVGLLYNAGFSGGVMEVQALVEAARGTGVTVIGIEVRTPNDFPVAYASIRKERLDALLVSVDSLTYDARNDIAEVAFAVRVPMIAEIPEFADAGAIFTYGIDILHGYRRGAYFVDKILKGAKPADLPIEQPTRFQLVVNLRAAKALGRLVPQSILVNATKVIQ